MFQNITSLDDYAHNMGLTAGAKRKLEEREFAINLIEKAQEMKGELTTEDYLRLNVSHSHETTDTEYARICKKFNAGNKITDEEIAYIFERDKPKHKEILEVLSERKRYEVRLRSCRYKEEIREEKLKTAGQWLKQAEVVNNNPYLENNIRMQMLFKITIITNHIDNAYVIFSESEDFKKLPFKEQYEEREAMMYENMKIGRDIVAAQNKEKAKGNVNTKGTNMYKETSKMDYDMEVEKLKKSFFSKA